MGAALRRALDAGTPADALRPLVEAVRRHLWTMFAMKRAVLCSDSAPALLRACLLAMQTCACSFVVVFQTGLAAAAGALRGTCGPCLPLGLPSYGASDSAPASLRASYQVLACA